MVIDPASGPAAIRFPEAPPPAGGSGFGEVLRNAVYAVEQSREHSENLMGRLLSGEGEELHSVALAAQQAELTLEMFLQVRNKVVQAYQEIMRMQV